MAPTSFRKAIGVVKDRTSISIAKMANNVDPELDILIVKATNHDTHIPKIRYFSEILRKTMISRDLVKECVCLISKRIEKTHDWIVALKCLILVYRLIVDGGRNFVKEIACANASGRMLSNMCVFRDEAHSNSGDYSDFVRNFGMFLVKKVELMVFDEMWLRRKVNSSDDLRRMEEREKKMEENHLRDELLLEKVLSRMERLQRCLQRVLNIRCSRCVNGKYRELLFLALTPVIEDSFVLYEDVSGGLSFLSDCFWEMEYLNSVKTYGTYATVAKQFDDLAEFYGWCKGVGFDKPSDEYPEVESISEELLRSMEELVKKRMNETKNYKKSSSKMAELMNKMSENNVNAMNGYVQDSDAIGKDMVIVKVNSDASSAEEKGECMALSLIHEDQNDIVINPWEEFSDIVESHIASDWETSAANTNNEDWQMVLVASAGNLTEQKVNFGDSFDAVMLNDMYDQGVVKQFTGGSASSLALPWHEERRTTVLALPSTEGSVHMVNQDPFTASLAVPPPAYVQIVELENKFQLLQQEQKIWEEYEANGMQGQVSRVLSGSTTDNATRLQERMPHLTSSNDLGLL
ncbi:putative clathrin assembly protein At2g25430 [Chenopodium quinoa]|uniref:ENTH domain-containing protein n=1 Tax=Chenopodium quinoa TaxID=63459 RepID=A0A803LH74_CHEQI|nr:putative clathrin assembly protein At2g25430 [Chenopodium quinoa]